jgi:phospholipid/cholesterol/gamma-HCH transport system permease protein
MRVGTRPAPGPGVALRRSRTRDAARRVTGGFTDFVETTGEMGVLAGKTITSAIRPPISYGSEFANQLVFAMRVCWFPMIVASVCFSFGPAGIQAANFLALFGALDRLGGVFVVVVVREFAPLVSAIVMAGVAGTAMTADLGTRRIREELDALMVLGVDPVKSLVVPRFLALVLATGLFNVYALVFGTFGGVLVTLVNHAPLDAFWGTYFNNATTVELWGSILKAFGYGGIIAIVCCYKGLRASGGPEGVGRAVNQAIVISFMGIGVFDFVFTQVLLATHPILSTPR